MPETAQVHHPTADRATVSITVGDVEVTGSGTPGPASGRARRRGREHSPCTPYDFRRPIQLSREHSRMLQVAFDGFARQTATLLTSALRTVCQASLLSVDQRGYGEYIESLLAPTYMTIFTIDPISGRGVLEMPLPAVMSCIDHTLGGPGSTHQPVRSLSDIESVVFRGIVDRLLGEMRYSLGSIVALQPEISDVEYSPQFAQVAATADVMVIATFDLRISDRGHQMTVCLPFTGLLPHLTRAAAPAPVSERERALRALAAQSLHQQFQQVPVDVAVRLRTTPVTPDQLHELRPGDVISLAHPASAPLDVAVEDTVFAHATAGAQGHRLAALIVGVPESDPSASRESR